MLLKCNLSIVLIWIVCMCLPSLPCVILADLPQFPFQEQSAMTVCVGVTPSFPWFKISSVGRFILFFFTLILDSGARLSFVHQVQSGEVHLSTGCLAMPLRPLKKHISSLRWKRQVPNSQTSSIDVPPLKYSWESTFYKLYRFYKGYEQSIFENIIIIYLAKTGSLLMLFMFLS